LIRQTTQSLMKIPQRKKGFSALCIFDIGGDSLFTGKRCHQPNLG
jgi:hypothetical protein